MVGYALVVLLLSSSVLWAHEARDFDDSVLYKIDFEIPDFEKEPDLKKHLMTFHTRDQEKYECVVPVLDAKKDQPTSDKPDLVPLALLQSMFSSHSCSYRIEAYWSYEICHGLHVRQYHEEREGKNVKFQEYYLGRWNDILYQQLVSDIAVSTTNKYKTTKIDNTNYPYFEMEMTDGTICDIINEPRRTFVRYVCYPHGKNEIYSFKETSSCNYEAIILTSVLCVIKAFHPEESKEISIKCFNSLTETHKPLSMLRQEFNEMQMSEDDFPIPKEASQAAEALARTAASGERYMSLYNLGEDVDKIVVDLMALAGMGVDVDTTSAQQESLNQSPPKMPTSTDITPAIMEFISEKNCLIGGTGWWKYEFCYGRHVRQFHKDKKTQTELFLGYFSEDAHHEWVGKQTKEKGAIRANDPSSLWHHYADGTRCDRTGLPRAVDVKLTCKPIRNSAAIVSMYLLEPKTCQYILVVESPIICGLLPLADEFGLIRKEKLDLVAQLVSTDSDTADKAKSGVAEVSALDEDVRV